MPCINNTNGQPVPGAFGYCPIGSTWKDNVVAEPAQETQQTDLVGREGYMSEEDYAYMEKWEGGGVQNVGDWFTPGGAIKVGLGAGMSLPVIRAGINAFKSNKGLIGKKLKNLMGTLLMKRSTIYPINQTKKGWQW